MVGYYKDDLFKSQQGKIHTLDELKKNAMKDGYILIGFHRSFPHETLDGWRLLILDVDAESIVGRAIKVWRNHCIRRWQHEVKYRRWEITRMDGKQIASIDYSKWNHPLRYCDVLGC